MGPLVPPLDSSYPLCYTPGMTATETAEETFERMAEICARDFPAFRAKVGIFDADDIKQNALIAMWSIAKQGKGEGLSETDIIRLGRTVIRRSWINAVRWETNPKRNINATARLEDYDRPTTDEGDKARIKIEFLDTLQALRRRLPSRLRVVLDTLLATEGNQSKAARELGMTFRQVHYAVSQIRECYASLEG